MARSCTCPYVDAKDGYLQCKMMYAIHQDSSSINIKYIKHNCKGGNLRHHDVMDSLLNVSI